MESNEEDTSKNVDVCRLENLCISNILKQLSSDYSFARCLPSKLLMRIATVKSQMEMFEQCYARFLQHPTIQFPIVLTSDTQLDMNAVILCCIQCYLRLADCNINVLGSVNKSFPYSAFIDTQIPKKSSYDQNSLIKNAFVLAAVGAFDDVCEQIWPKLSTGMKHYLNTHESVPEVVRVVALHLSNHFLAYRNYPEICTEAAVNGWYGALGLWLQRIENPEIFVTFDIQLNTLIGDFKEVFYLFFPDGRIAEVIKALADTPNPWKDLANRIGVELIDWGPRLNITEARRHLRNDDGSVYCFRRNNYSSVNTIFKRLCSRSNSSSSSSSSNNYVEYIDLLLECSHRYRRNSSSGRVEQLGEMLMEIN
uniref:Uncharacterized protein n=1 Tax=Syphacia muris TaxID=451379 RepID=A0A0N5AZB0_9BILA